MSAAVGIGRGFESGVGESAHQCCLIFTVDAGSESTELWDLISPQG